MAHLEKATWGNMTQEGGHLNKVKFADAVGPSTAKPEAAGSAQGFGSAARPQKANAKPMANPNPKSKPDPTDDDPVDSEPALSGDDK